MMIINNDNNKATANNNAWREAAVHKNFKPRTPVLARYAANVLLHFALESAVAAHQRILLALVMTSAMTKHNATGCNWIPSKHTGTC